MNRPSILVAALLFIARPTPGRAADASDRAELDALRAQMAQLQERLAILERKLEVREDATSAPTAPAKVTITDKGYTFASADDANSLRLRGLAQLDSRLYFGDGGGLANNAFVLRRARLIAEGTLARNTSFQFTTEFGGSAVSILDANFTIAVAPALQVKFGKFKVPVGLEFLQSDATTFFNERSLATTLVPARDLGVQAAGDFAGGRASYALGVFGGVPDGATSTNGDFDNDKDVATRVTVSPFKQSPGSALKGFTLGLAGSEGRQKTSAGRPAGYRTDGQQTFFAYNPSVVADGPTWRVSPQLDFRSGAFGVLSEYVVSAVNVRPSPTAPKTELRHRGWQIAAGYVLTGEDSSFTGVSPRDNFDFAAGTWGAFEVVGRLSGLRIDDRAFPAFAAAATNADAAKAVGLGLNWYLSRAVEFKIDYYQTRFGFSPLAPAVSTTPFLRQDEKAFISRFQLAF